MLFISLLLLFYALTAFTLSLSLPSSSILAGQTTSAVWTRNGLFDPLNFVVLLRNSAQPPDQGISNFAKSGGRQSGQIFFTFPNEGTYVLEAYTNDTFQQLLTTSDTLRVLAAEAPISEASLLPPDPEVTGLAISASEIPFPTSPAPSSSSPTPGLTQVSTSTDTLPSSALPSNLQSNATPRAAIIGGAVSGALILTVLAFICLHRCQRLRRQQRSIFFRDKMIQQGSGGASWTALTFPHTPNLDTTLETGTISSLTSVPNSAARSPPRSKFIELIPGRTHSPLAVQYMRSASPASSNEEYSGYGPSDGSAQIGRAV